MTLKTTRSAATASAFAATFSFALVLAPPLSAAPEKRAVTIEELLKVKGVAEPAIAPGGRSLAFTVTTTDLPAVKRWTNLWRVDADGKNARALTVLDKRDASPAYSPDGATLAFLSTRSGTPQVWVLPLAGGEPEKKTDVPGGVGAFRFSPDGKRLFLVADVWPSCGADLDCNRKKDDAMEKGKMKAVLADSLFVRHWDAWEDGKRTHVLRMELADAKAPLVDLTPGDFDSPAFSVGGGADFDVSPDGKELAFTSSRDANPAFSTNVDLFVVPVDGTPEQLKAPKNLTAKNPAFDGSPRYSPDGKSIAFRMQRTPGYESDRFLLALHDRASGASRVLTETFDSWVGDYRFHPDGRRIFFLADMKGRTPLFDLDLATGALQPATAVGHVDSFEISPDGTWAVLARRQMHLPTELWRLALAGKEAGTATPLTTQNQALLAEVDFRPMEEAWVDSPSGKKIQVLLVKPHGFDPAKKYPVIVNVHGGPQMQWADAFRGDAQVYPGAGYVVAFPNPHGSTGWGQDFTAAISGDWDGKVMKDVLAVADWLSVQPWADKDRMGAMGWSWGGYAMMWLAGHDHHYKALASMMGVYDLRSMYSMTEELWFPEWDLKGTPWQNPEGYQKQSPSSYVEKFKTPTLVITGQKDFRVPYTQSLAFFTDLQKMGVPSRLIVLENASHWPGWYDMVLYYSAHLDWFHRYLGGAPSPYDPKALVANDVFGKEKDEKKDAPKADAPK
ncbi:MAG: S9 family peptidase [Holophagales bacterium]|nr:S9 family peptidase [Holophagales bacterium]